MQSDTPSLLQSLLEKSGELIAVVDMEATLLESSRLWRQTFGQEPLARQLTDESMLRLREALRLESAWKRPLHLDIKDISGCYRRIALRQTPDGLRRLLFVRDLEEQQSLLARLMELRHTSQRTSAELRRLANTDPLTGVSNRREVWRNARWIWANAHSASVALLDIDKFKRINDVYGHESGDIVLQGVAEALSRTVGPGAVVGRWGGEEFVAVFEGDATNRVDAIVRCCNRVRFDGAAADFRLTASVGMAIAPDTGISIADAVGAADAAMYAAKQAGGDRALVRVLQSRSEPPSLPTGERRTNRFWNR